MIRLKQIELIILKINSILCLREKNKKGDDFLPRISWTKNPSGRNDTPWRQTSIYLPTINVIIGIKSLFFYFKQLFRKVTATYII